MRSLTRADARDKGLVERYQSNRTRGHILVEQDKLDDISAAATGEELGPRRRMLAGFQRCSALGKASASDYLIWGVGT